MTALKTIAAAAALTAVTALTATPVLAQAAFSEPAAFASMYPNRDVLNGGALTPYGRLEAQGYTALEAVAIHEGRLHATHRR